MTILHLRASNFYGGPERQLHFHARAAKNSEYKVTISSFLENGTPPEFLAVIAEDKIATHTFEVASAYDRSAIGLVKEYLRAHAVDILCTHDYRTHTIGWLATRGGPTRWVAFSRGYTKDNFKVRMFHALDKVIIRLADHIVAVSHAQKKRLLRLWIDSHKISVAYNSIEPEAFDAVDPVNLHKKFDLPRESLIAVAAGRFSEEKGQRYLVQAAAQVLQKQPDWRFLLFGDGPDFEAVTTDIRQRGLETRILCPGHEKNFIGCLKGADLLINPSLSEGLPNIVLEGMAVGVPVLATNVGGVPEMIVDGKNGWLVPPGDARALAQAIESTLTDPSCRQDWPKAALETVRETFSFDRQFADITAVYARFAKEQ